MAQVQIINQKNPRLDDRFVFKGHDRRIPSVSSFFAEEKLLGRRVTLQIYRKRDSGGALDQAMRMGGLQNPYSARLLDVIELPIAFVLVFETVEAPELSEWAETASVKDVKEVKAQAREWVKEWDMTQTSGVSLGSKSIRVMRTESGKPFCKVVAAIGPAPKGASSQSLEKLFSDLLAESETSGSKEPEASDSDWFDSIFDNRSKSERTPKVDSRRSVVAAGVGILVGVAALVAAILSVIS